MIVNSWLAVLRDKLGGREADYFATGEDVSAAFQNREQ
jgi:hypothetical protein